MVDAKETERILDKFFRECWRYWNLKGNTDRTSFESALEDVKRLKYDPYVPAGELLDEEAKNKFIHYREMDLGR